MRAFEGRVFRCCFLIRRYCPVLLGVSAFGEVDSLVQSAILSFVPLHVILSRYKAESQLKRSRLL